MFLGFIYSIREAPYNTHQPDQAVLSKNPFAPEDSRVEHKPPYPHRKDHPNACSQCRPKEYLTHLLSIATVLPLFEMYQHVVDFSLLQFEFEASE